MRYRQLAVRLGAEPSSLLAQSGLSDADLADPDRYISYRNVLLAFEAPATELGISSFGLLLAAEQDISFLGALALAVQSAQSVRDGLLIAARNLHFHSPDIAIKIGETDASGFERVTFRILVDNIPPVPQATEHAVSHICKVVAALSGGMFAPASIHFRHSPQGDRETYLRCLEQYPVFNSDFDGITMRSSEFRRKTADRNEHLQSFVERFMIGIAPSPSLSIRDQVRDVVKNFGLGQSVQLADVARVLQMHPRTLQRRLQKSGTTFAQVQDDHARETAGRLLGQPTIPLSVIARTIGYSDQATFTRRCHRWFGTTPLRHRQSTAEWA